MRNTPTEVADPIAAYAERISLAAPFVPTPGPANEGAVIAAIQADEHSQPFVRRYPPPKLPQESRDWIKAALTVRPAGELPTELAEQMDRLLQAELRRKAITDATSLPRLTGPYPVAGRVSIWNGDITTLRIGAITNAANTQMVGCFQPFHACIDNAIHTAAGPQLREDCARVIDLQGHDEPTGRAKITRAYNLPSGFVLHTVGPIVSAGSPAPEHAGELADSYAACLMLAAERGVKSVALCGISTGVFGYPADQAASIALRAVADWYACHPDALDHVVFNTYGKAATALYAKATSTWG